MQVFFFFVGISEMPIMPFSSQYFIALSTRVEESMRMADSSVIIVTPGVIFTARSFSSRLARASKGSTVSCTAFDTLHSLEIVDSCSEDREIITRFWISPFIRSTWFNVDSVHSDFPFIISMNSVLAEMTARGVLSSWEAFVMNSFCRVAFSIEGWMAR